jgi:hypothetical protein
VSVGSVLERDTAFNTDIPKPEGTARMVKTPAVIAPRSLGITWKRRGGRCFLRKRIDSGEKLPPSPFSRVPGIVRLLCVFPVPAPTAAISCPYLFLLDPLSRLIFRVSFVRIWKQFRDSSQNLFRLSGQVRYLARAAVSRGLASVEGPFIVASASFLSSSYPGGYVLLL